MTHYRVFVCLQIMPQVRVPHKELLLSSPPSSRNKSSLLAKIEQVDRQNEPSGSFEPVESEPRSHSNSPLAKRIRTEL